MAARNSAGSCCCAVCDRSNHPSICAGCVNYRLNDYASVLKSSRSVRDSLYTRLNSALIAKNKASEQQNWKVLQKAKIAHLKERLSHLEMKLSQEKSAAAKATNELKTKEKALESAFNALEKSRSNLLEKSSNLICTQSLWHMTVTSELLHKQSVVIKQICKLFPLRHVSSDADKRNNSSSDLICNAHLPRALDPRSVPCEELGASLGYMVQLLNLVIPVLAAPSLHNSGFAGSCSRIWQRQSYWDARPSSQSHEYPLFIPRQNFSSSTSEETSWSDKNTSNFGVTSMESLKKPSLDGSRNLSFNYSSASLQSPENYKDLQKGISLLKKSVANTTAYCYNWLGLDFPSDASTFEAFGKLLATLSSSKEVRSAFSLKMACSRSGRQTPQFNKSVWQVNSLALTGSLTDSGQSQEWTQDNTRRLTLPHLSDNSASNTSFFLFTPEVEEPKNPEDIRNNNKKTKNTTVSVAEDWDMVEHPTLPPPSHSDDVEHWTRAMFTDATSATSPLKR